MSSTPTVDADQQEVERGFSARFHRLYYGQTRFDFVRRRKTWFAASAIVILAGLISLGTRGINFDIEFVGGTSWQVQANGATVNDARAAVTPYGLGGATITMLGTGKNQQIQIEAKLAGNKGVTSSSTTAEVSKALAKATHHSSVNAVTVQEVGPTWGSQITHKAIIALVVFFILIALYISIFFEWKMALAAIIAVIHDILVTVGIYSLSGFLVTPDTVVAFLTILGYSLYDTIVVFDRVRDNTKGLGASGKLTITDVVNLSMNQTLARSINTSLVAILPILAVLVLGAEVLGATTLEYFGLALLIGLASGAYSSLFIASPLVAVLKEREPRYVQIRQRLESRGTATMLLTPAAVASGALEDRGGGGGGSSSKRRRRSAAAPEADRGVLRPGAQRDASGGNGNGSKGRGRAEPDEAEVEEDGLDELSQAEEVNEPASNGAGAPGGGAGTRRGGSGANGSARPQANRGGGGGSKSNRPAPRPRKKRRR